MARGKGGPLTRWTADTEVAFLLALRMTGSMKLSCAQIGRSTTATAKRRERLPEFKARWEAVLDERRREHLGVERARRLSAAGCGAETGAGAMANRVRYDGWTPLRQRAFLRALTETGSMAEACRAVRIAPVSARRMRGKYPSFDAACERALARAAGMLEQAAWERAVEGWDEPIIHAGQVVGQRRRYSDALLRLLLQREATQEAARAEAEAAHPKRMAAEEVNALLERQLDALHRRRRREERERQIAWADEMARRGLAP